jgi:mRNA interferase MazF
MPIRNGKHDAEARRHCTRPISPCIRRPREKASRAVVQSDHYNATVRHVIVAEKTSNLTLASDKAHCLIDVATPDGRMSGLSQDSLVACLHLATMSQDRIDRSIGSLSDALMRKINDCLKASLDVQ